MTRTIWTDDGWMMDVVRMHTETDRQAGRQADRQLGCSFHARVVCSRSSDGRPDSGRIAGC